MLLSAAKMETSGCRTDLFNGLFCWEPGLDGAHRVTRHALSPASIPCPATGRPLHVATIEAAATAICPSCANHGLGGFVSFVADLRMAYACPQCCQLVWLSGA
jgi:hypothetical protein